MNDNTQDDVTYRDLVRSNRNFRLFITSYLVTNLGEWLTYIASIDLIENKLQSSSQGSRTAISILVLVRLLPTVFFSGFGGTLADTYDRRRLMVVLDIAGGICALFFVIAYELQSIFLVYVATVIQQIVGGLYMPSSNSIVPLLTENDKQLQKGMTLVGLVWSGMSAFGSASSGFLVTYLGAKSCFLVDCATFLVSAFLLWLIDGEYNVSTNDKKEKESSFTSLINGSKYLRSSFFLSLIFLKASAALAYGACDVLNVVLSEEGDGNPNTKLGILFSLVGVGCLLGPLLTEPFVSVELPSTVQLSCVLSFGICFFGYIGWSFKSSFLIISIFATIRSAGSSIIWINSTILLQKFSSPEMLGRVLAVDYALALLAEALSAFYAGLLIDKGGLSAYEVSFVLAIETLGFTLLWTVYTIYLVKEQGNIKLLCPSKRQRRLLCYGSLAKINKYATS